MSFAFFLIDIFYSLNEKCFVNAGICIGGRSNGVHAIELNFIHFPFFVRKGCMELYFLSSATALNYPIAYTFLDIYSEWQVFQKSQHLFWTHSGHGRLEVVLRSAQKQYRFFQSSSGRFSSTWTWHKQIDLHMKLRVLGLHT